MENERFHIAMPEREALVLAPQKRAVPYWHVAMEYVLIHPQKQVVPISDESYVGYSDCSLKTSRSIMPCR